MKIYKMTPIVVLVAVLLCWVIKIIVEHTTNKSIIPITTRVKGDPTIPDSAQGFGYKMMWVAVKTDNQQRIAELLKIKNISKCNWKEGVNMAYTFEDSSIYITPCIDGWTFACGINLLNIQANKESLDEGKHLLEILSKEFGEAQYFFSFRTADCYIWMRARNGSITRVYDICQGETISIEGEQTDFEKNYNLVNTLSEEAKDSNYFERKDIVWPDEEFVMKVAENWSIDPSKLDDRKDLFGKFGLIGTR